MAVIADPESPGGGFGTGEEEAEVEFVDGEPIVWEFVPGNPENAVRNLYRAVESGVVFGLVLSQNAQKPLNAGVVNTVARQLGAMWNANAAVPGVTDIAETQDTRPLGGLQDVAQVYVESTSGKSAGILTLTQDEFRSDVFAEAVAAERANLDALEKV